MKGYWRKKGGKRFFQKFEKFQEFFSVLVWAQLVSERAFNSNTVTFTYTLQAINATANNIKIQYWYHLYQKIVKKKFISVKSQFFCQKHPFGAPEKGISFHKEMPLILEISNWSQIRTFFEKHHICEVMSNLIIS